MADNPPVLHNSEDFFEWKPSIIRFLHHHFPTLFKWLPKVSDEEYPDPEVEDPPLDPGEFPSHECIFDADASVSDARFAQQNMELYKINRLRFIEYDQARIKCAKVLAASIGGDVKEKLMVDQNYIKHEEECNFQLMWIDIHEAHRMKGKLLRDKQDQYLDFLKNMQQGDDEDIKSFNSRFDKVIKHLSALDCIVSEAKKADYYLNSLNNKFDGLRMKYLANEYDDDDKEFKVRIVIQDALKWEMALKSRLIYSKSTKFSSEQSKVSSKIELGEYGTYAKTLTSTSETKNNLRSSSISTGESDIPNWLTRKLSEAEYNALSKEQKKIKATYNAGNRFKKNEKLVCRACFEEGHFIRDCPEIKKIQQNKKMA